MKRPVVVILLSAFWPGHESSGPNISIRAMCEALGEKFEFRIVALDRPPGGEVGLADTTSWHDLGYAFVHYVVLGRFGYGAPGLVDLLRSTPYSVLMLNGFFCREFTIPTLIARRMGRLPESTVILSPRGEMTQGALSLKPQRKANYRKLASLLGLYRGVVVHATSALEADDCARELPNNEVVLAPNFRSLMPLPTHNPRPHGTPLRLIFVGRVTPVKRLDFALKALRQSGVSAHLNIYGPIADPQYKHECDELIELLPEGCSARWAGEVSNTLITELLATHDALLLPSLSENFGHAIFESLASGTPVVIGDQTPWVGLPAVKAGFDLPVSDLTGFADAIRTLAGMAPDEVKAWRDGARTLAAKAARESDASARMVALLERSIAIPGVRSAPACAP